MRIALVTPGFSHHIDDWAIPALQSLACRLAQSHDVQVFSLRYPTEGLYQFCNLTHHAMGGVRFGLASLSVWRQAIQAIVAEHRRAPFDVLHAFWADEPGLSAVLAGAIIKRPALVSVGGGELVYLPDIDYGTQDSIVRRLIIRYALRKADLVTVGSGYQQELCFERALAPEKVQLAPLGVNVKHFRPGAVPSWREPTVVQAASLVPVKNQPLLLEVLAMVKTAVPAIKLIVAGSGPLQPSLQQMARRLHLDQHIIWQPQVAHPAMPGVYQQAHLYLQTSRHESQGMAVLEAMSCGLPVVGTPVGILPQVACQPSTWDKETLAAQIVHTLADRSAYANQRQIARRIAEEQFSLRITTDKFVALYRQLGGGWSRERMSAKLGRRHGRKTGAHYFHPAADFPVPVGSGGPDGQSFARRAGRRDTAVSG
jgi:glycosyltransferase involved in cell wall biosynthesis